MVLRHLDAAIVRRAISHVGSEISHAGMTPLWIVAGIKGLGRSEQYGERQES